MSLDRIQIETIMAVSLFVIGFVAALGGIFSILAREYHEAMRGLSAQSTRIAEEAIAEKGIQETIQATANLVAAVNQLVRTATGTGLILLSGGVGICYLGYTLLP
jgi:hypothetical protein